MNCRTRARSKSGAAITNWLVVANKNSITLRLLSKSSDGPFSSGLPAPDSIFFLFVRWHSLWKKYSTMLSPRIGCWRWLPNLSLFFIHLALSLSGGNWSTEPTPASIRLCGRTLRAAHLYSRPTVQHSCVFVYKLISAAWKMGRDSRSDLIAIVLPRFKRIRHRVSIRDPIDSWPPLTRGRSRIDVEFITSTNAFAKNKEKIIPLRSLNTQTILNYI